MSSYFDGPEQRREPRFHPKSQKVYWRRMGAPAIESSELIDVSQGGLAFRRNEDSPRLERGDEIVVRHMGRDHQATHFAVVWDGAANASGIVGCTRLSPVATAPKAKRAPYNLILAKLRRRMQPHSGAVARRDDSVVLGTLANAA